MSYLGPPHDVFVSYAHDDNLDGWVTQLALELQAEVRRHLPRDDGGERADVTVWTDDSLIQSGPVDERLQEVLDQSSTVLVVTSPWYLESSWCKKEGLAFFDRGLASRDYRFFIAQKEQTDRGDWPSFLRPGGDASRGTFLSTEFFEAVAPGRFASLPILTAAGYRDPRTSPRVRALGEAIADTLSRLRD